MSNRTERIVLFVKSTNIFKFEISRKQDQEQRFRLQLATYRYVTCKTVITEYIFISRKKDL